MLVNVVLDSQLNRCMFVRLITPLLRGSITCIMCGPMIVSRIDLSTSLPDPVSDCTTSFNLVLNYLLFCFKSKIITLPLIVVHSQHG